MSDHSLQEIFNRVPGPSVRIFGIGKNSEKILEEINSWDFPGVKTLLFDDVQISPLKENDEMVIFINPDNYDISTMTQSFFQADILTLVIASPGFNDITNSCDAICLTEQSFIKNTVWGILYPIFQLGYIEFDFYDLLQLMKNQGKFKVLVGNSQTSDKKLDSLMHHFKEAVKQSGTIENIAMIFSFNEITRQSFTANDLGIVNETIRNLPETIGIRWGLVIDKKIKDNQIQMITIFSGKNLNF